MRMRWRSDARLLGKGEDKNPTWILVQQDNANSLTECSLIRHVNFTDVVGKYRNRGINKKELIE